MTGQYASTTSVSSERSRAEIERVLVRWGADQFAYGWEPGKAMIQFRAEGRLIRFALPLPARDDPAFVYTPAKHEVRSADAIDRLHEQAVRSRWRALVLFVKAQLEAIDAGLVTFEDVFLAQTVLPDGSTTGEWMHPQIERAYASGQMPHAMPALAAGEDRG